MNNQAKWLFVYHKIPQIDEQIIDKSILDKTRILHTKKPTEIVTNSIITSIQLSENDMILKIGNTTMDVRHLATIGREFKCGYRVVMCVWLL